jgi:hypothetical protein
MLRALAVLLFTFGLFVWMAARASFRIGALESSMVLVVSLLPGYLLWRIAKKRRRTRAAERAARSINP